jgi:PilZ domain-containing protein
MFPGETRSHSASRHATELRRHAREDGRWPIVLETRAGHLLRLPLIDVSPGGAQVRLTEQLTEGTRGRVYFLPPYWNPRAVEANVWRIDLDGIVLRFTDSSFGTSPAEAVRRSDGGDNG